MVQPLFLRKSFAPGLQLVFAPSWMHVKNLEPFKIYLNIDINGIKWDFLVMQISSGTAQTACLLMLFRKLFYMTLLNTSKVWVGILGLLIYLNYTELYYTKLYLLRFPNSTTLYLFLYCLLSLYQAIFCLFSYGFN